MLQWQLKWIAQITNVYFIATFFNCQEEKLDKENADEVRKAYLKM